MEHVLPRIKTRKRKRRPPNNRERWAMFWFVYCIVNVILAVYWLAISHDVFFQALFVLCGAIQVWGVQFWWPVVKNYIKHGYIDE